MASRGIVAAYRPLLDAMGLTCPQYLVMLGLTCVGLSTRESGEPVVLLQRLIDHLTAQD